MPLAAGADRHATDKGGVAPLHRAVRTRAEPAVRAPLDGGADPALRARSGSTPLQLAQRSTRRSGSGTPAAREQQARILHLLGHR